MSLKMDVRCMIRRISDQDLEDVRNCVEAEVERRLSREQNNRRVAGG